MAMLNGKKKMSRKAKRVIRKTLSAICMASALIVALVPATPTKAYVDPGTTTSTNYSYGVEDTDKTDFSYYDSTFTGVILDKYNNDSYPGFGYNGVETNLVKTYKISQLSDGSFDYNWQFKVYSLTVNGSPMAVIAKYNDTYAKGTVSIDANIPITYAVCENDFYEAYKTAHFNAKAAASKYATVKKLDNTDYPTNDVHNQSKFSISSISSVRENDDTYDDYWLKKYWPVQYNSFKEVYEAFVADKTKYDNFSSAVDTYNNAVDSYTTAYLMYVTDPENNVEPVFTAVFPEVPVYSTLNTYTVTNTFTKKLTDGTTESVIIKKPTDAEGPVLTCWVSDMSESDDGLYQFFCEVHPDYFSFKSQDTYRLYKSKDSRGGTGEGSLTNQYVYLLRGTAGLNINSENRNDEFGFRITSQTSVIAVGAHAFEGTTNVLELALAGEVKYIGDYAFCNSFVNKITFSNVQDIGNRSFKGCTKLTSINIGDTTVNIGTESFYGCNVLASLILPQSIAYIGPGAFANCTKLSTIDLSAINQECNISDFCFYNDIAIQNLKLSDNIARIGEACFACTMTISGNLTTFQFPNHIGGNVTEKKCNGVEESRTPIGNFALAGRTNLAHVIMPADYGKSVAVTLPYGVFFNCTNLLDVTFPDSCGYVSFGNYVPSSGTGTRTIFDSILTDDFRVYGPELDDAGNIASPRKSTWGKKTGLGNDVPYIYIDTYGKEQVEISNGQYILIIDQNGVLQSCDFATQEQRDAATAGIDLVIPETVGDTKVTGVASGCFSEPLFHDNIKTLVIADNTISEIEPSAFKDCINLEKVSIGNSVTKIGNSAFEGCSKLVEVEFATPKNGYASFPLENIGEKAFSTGAEKLIFTGDIDEAYGPFVWAMQVDNYVDEEKGVRVCYKTGYPNYLTVIVDNRNGYPTLVDYPHYDQLNTYENEYNTKHHLTADTENLITRYEHLGEEVMDVSGNVSYTYSVTVAEEKIINSVLNPVVPSGIKSIDVNGYLNNSSPLGEGFSAVASNSNNVSLYLTSSPYYVTYKSTQNSAGTSYTGGLFKGYYGAFSDGTYAKEYSGDNAYELETIGNDRITSLTLNSVKYLPDYAFYSCERLSSLSLGKDLTEMGDAPFTGCLRLSSIGSTNDNFICYNGIVYSTNEDGTYNIVEVLSSRGQLVGSQKIKATDEDPNLANVSCVLPGAFENCDSITGIDFRGMNLLKEIPDNCFKDCDRLNQVILPDNITSIGHNAFEGCMEGTELVCYGTEVFLPADAFGSFGTSGYVNSKRVISYADSAVRKAARDIGADVTEVLDDKVKVQFYDYDGRELSKLLYVNVGSSLALEDIPADPVRAGYTFAGWNKPLTNITTDMVIIATYKQETTPVDPSSISGNDSGNSGNNNNNNNNNNNPSNPSGDSGQGTTDKVTLYTLTVTNGNGSGSYAAGATVIITCTNPPAGQTFDKWVPTTDDLGIASVNVAATTLTMPAHEASVTATFKKAPSDNSGSGSGNGSGKNNNGGNNNNQNPNGTYVIISKPGISNTGLASATVSGSSDNYIVRITETAAATAAVEKALTNEYGSLENIRYSAMDISLYDSTGSTKITDTSGLSINITIPIPDVLTAYAGNNKAAAVYNEKLEKLTPKFTTIDGVPCITFTATHFSPYTIYVDASNIAPGTIDVTPKTGDWFGPKWFLVIGLAGMSIALFFVKDKKVAGIA